MDLIGAVFLIGLLLLLVLLLAELSNEPPARAVEDSVRNIQSIGQEARQEMDRICDEFIAQELELPGDVDRQPYLSQDHPEISPVPAFHLDAELDDVCQPQIADLECQG